jgi:hypothetical protein
VLWTPAGLTKTQARHSRLHDNAEKMLEELDPRRDRLFVVWRESFPFESLVFPLKDPASLRPFRCAAMSTVLPTPFTARRFQDFGVTDVYRAVCERPDVSLIAAPALVKLLREYLLRHYDLETELDFRAAFSHEGVPDGPGRKGSVYVFRADSFRPVTPGNRRSDHKTAP